MRLVYLIIGLALIGAMVLPFFMTGPDGLPLMTMDKFIDDNTPEVLDTPTEVYRWKDADGVWQFGDTPPETVNAETVEIEENLTPIKATWAAELKAREAQAGEANTGPNVKILHDAYGGKALQKAKDAAGLVEGHSEQLEELLKIAKPK